MKHPEAQSIFKYRDYREFIRDFYTSRKANDPKFSLRKMAKILSLPSHGHIIFLIDGARNAGGKSLAKMIHGFGFSGKEILYFENLVMYNQANSKRDKTFYKGRLTALLGKSLREKIEG